jgi:hypothetical protein
VAGSKALTDLTDPRTTRIWVLARTLQDEGFDAQRVEGDPTALTLLPVARAPVTVRCDQRESSGGQLWFFFPGGRPICPADDSHIAGAVAAVKAKVEERAR